MFGPRFVISDGGLVRDLFRFIRKVGCFVFVVSLGVCATLAFFVASLAAK